MFPLGVRWTRPFTREEGDSAKRTDSFPPSDSSCIQQQLYPHLQLYENETKTVFQLCQLTTAIPVTPYFMTDNVFRGQ